MKKSLSILLSFALVFGLFASMASAADTELTTAQKYQALVDKGVLKGNPDGDARLGNTLNRAEYATIAIAIAGLAEEKPATATFSDVNSKQWWYGAIEAAAKAGLVDGVGGGKFDPRSDVTIEQVIKVAVQAAGATPVEGAEVEGASAWAGPYIQAALDAGLIAAGLDYKASATRGQTIDVGYAVYEKLNPTEPAKVSVSSAKATNYDEVTVTLDKAVDTAKATLTLKRGTGTVATETKWSEDKKTATLTLTGAKIAEADYSVTLAGIDAEEIATATASFKGEDEKVAKLEFVTTSDEIAYTTAARVKLRAENQYGKLASFNSANYTISADAGMNPTLTKDSEGYLVVRMNTTTITGGSQKGLTQIPIYVYANDNHLTAFKSFKLGFEPFISKSELSEVTYDNGKKALVANGDSATAQLQVYDQYGNPVAVSQNLNPVFNNNVVPYLQDVKVTVDDYDSDDEYEARITLQKRTDKASSHTLTLYVGSSSSTVSFEVGTAKVATTLEFNSFDGTLAEGDKGKYVTFNAYDANGDKLTATELADNAKDGRFILNASGIGAGYKIVTVGPNKGKIYLPSVTASKNSYVFLSLSILSPNANVSKQLQIKVQPVREAASLKVDKKAHDKAVLNASSEFKIIVLDQYGDKFDNADAVASFLANNSVMYEFVNGSGTGAVGNPIVDSGITVTGALSNANGNAATPGGAATTTPVNGTGSSVAQVVYSSALADVNAAHNFQATVGKFGRASLKATLLKLDTTSGVYKAVSSPVAVAIESIDPSKHELNYSVSDITVYAAEDNKVLYPAGTFPVTGAASDIDDLVGAKGISVAVKDNAGNTVAFPDRVQDIATSNNNFVKVFSNKTSAWDGTKAWVAGNKAGEATVTAVVYKANGEQASLSAKVTVKNDAVVAESVTAKDGVFLAAGSVNTAQAAVLAEVTVKDNYGTEYKAHTAPNVIAQYQALLGIRYTISELTNVDTVQIDPVTGQLSGFVQTAGTTNYQFVVTATAPNGKTSSTVFHNDV